MAQVKYTDIGHGSPNDVLWMFADDTLYAMPAGMSRTHELVWGGDKTIDDHWKGRYETGTGYCSITPPASSMSRRMPPQWLRDALNQQFGVVRFYYFANVEDEFSPNPKYDRRR